MSRNRGQIMIIFVFALTVLLGFAALAIDGGMVYAERRSAQGAADNSSLAGGGTAIQVLDTNGVTYATFSCSNSAVLSAVNASYNAAVNSAQQNQISGLDNNLADKHGVEIICVDLPAQKDRYLDIHTQITTATTTSFLHFVYPGAVKNTVDAVVRIRPRADVLNGNAIVALTNQANRGIDFNGSALKLKVNGGGIFSNSELVCNGKNSVEVNSASYVSAQKKCTCDLKNLQKADAPLEITYPTPVCPTTNLGSRTGGTLSPGLYTDLSLTGGTMTFQPGLYCLTGNFKATGGNVKGTGVTIYMMNGKFEAEGGADLEMTAPTSSANGAIKGVLVYLAKGNTTWVKLEGSSDMTWGGTVYAPDAEINIGGNSRLETPGSGVTFTQLIGKEVKLHGNTEVTINYTAQVTNTVSPSLSLIR